MTNKKKNRIVALQAKQESDLTPEEALELKALLEEQAEEQSEQSKQQQNAQRKVPTIPSQVNISGTIVNVSDIKPKGDKFKHDTRIITVSEFGSDVTFDVFITVSQWAAYGCDKLLYPGNVVVFTLDDNIKDVTGYKAEASDVTLTFHDKSFKSFVRAIEKNTNNFILELAMKGIQIDVINLMIKNVNQVRASYTQATPAAAQSGSIF